MKRKILSIIVAMMLVMMTLSPMVLAAENDTSTTLKMYYTNDVHGYADAEYSDSGELTNIGYAKVKGYVDSQQADGKMLLDVGDSIQGTAFASLDEGESVAKVLDTMGYAATVPGNHEFDYGLTQLQNIYKESNSNVVCVNARKDGELLFNPYMIQEVAGLKVGILGVTTQECAQDLNNREGQEGVDFGTKESILNDVENATNELKAQNCDLIVALSHVGISDDQDFTSEDIANADPDIDVIMDGHVHKVYNEQCNGVWITSSGLYLKDLGEVDVTISEDGTKNITCKTMPAADFQDVQPDATVQATVDEINSEQDVILNQVIGYTPEELNGRITRKDETNLTKLFTDALRNYTGADLVFLNGGGFRTSIPAGDITVKSIVDVCPFDNGLVTMQITGQQIIDQIKKELDTGSDIPQTSGIQVLIDRQVITDSQGREDYIDTLVNVTKDGQPIDPDATYTLATTDYLAGGSSGYDILSTIPVDKTYGSSNKVVEDYVSTVDFNELNQEQYLIFDTTGQYSNMTAQDTTNQMSATEIVWICIIAAVIIAVIVVIVVRSNKKNAKA